MKKQVKPAVEPLCGNCKFFKTYIADLGTCNIKLPWHDARKEIIMVTPKFRCDLYKPKD